MYSRVAGVVLMICLMSAAAAQPAPEDALWSSFKVGMSVDEVRGALSSSGITVSKGFSDEQPIRVNDDVSFGPYKGRPEFHFLAGTLNHVELSFDGLGEAAPDASELNEALQAKYGSPKIKDLKKGYFFGQAPGYTLHYVYETPAKHVELDEIVIVRGDTPVALRRDVSIWKPESHRAWLKFKQEQSAAARAAEDAAKREEIEDLKSAL